MLKVLSSRPNKKPISKQNKKRLAIFSSMHIYIYPHLISKVCVLFSSDSEPIVKSACSGTHNARQRQSYSRHFAQLFRRVWVPGRTVFVRRHDQTTPIIAYFTRP